MLYQLLFRHFFYCKHVERLLCSAWMSGKSAKQHALNAVHWYAQAFALRQQMLHFIQNFQYYMMVEVVEPNWLAFEAGVKSVANVDELQSQHVDFLNSCLQDCMLTSPQLLNILHKLMAVCVTFCNYMQRLTHSALNTKDANQQPTALATLQAVSQGSDKTDQRASRKAFLDDVRYTSSDDSLASAVMTSQKNFTRLLSDLLWRIADDSTRVGECKLMNLVNRLDYNGFYTQHQQQRFDDQLDQSNMSLLAEEVGPQLRHDSATGNVESKTA
jgi:gamma-tubulin complex component 2